MSKIRAWYWPDGKISITHPDLRYDRFLNRSIEDWKRQKPLLRRMSSWLKEMPFISEDEWIDFQLNQVAIKAPQFADLDFTDMDISELPNGADPTDRADRGRWRGTKLTGIRIDGNVVLRKDLYKRIDDELGKQNPSSIGIERLRRKLERKEHD